MATMKALLHIHTLRLFMSIFLCSHIMHYLRFNFTLNEKGAFGEYTDSLFDVFNMCDVFVINLLIGIELLLHRFRCNMVPT